MRFAKSISCGIFQLHLCTIRSTKLLARGSLQVYKLLASRFSFKQTTKHRGDGGFLPAVQKIKNQKTWNWRCLVQRLKPNCFMLVKLCHAVTLCEANAALYGNLFTSLIFWHAWAWTEASCIVLFGIFCKCETIIHVSPSP